MSHILSSIAAKADDRVQALADTLVLYLDSLTSEDASMVLNGRRLQQNSSSVNINRLRSAMNSLLRIKYSQADQMCQSLGASGQWLNDQSYFEMIVKKQPIGKTVESPLTENFVHNLTGVYEGQQMELSVPTRELVERTLAINPEAKWICFQVTFFKVNPLLLVSETPDDFIFVDGSKVITTITSLDSKGFHLLGDDKGRNETVARGISGLQKPYVLNYPYGFPEGANAGNFDRRDVSCAHFWTDTNVQEGKWSTAGCDTSFDFDNNFVKCSCGTMSDNYYKLMKNIHVTPMVT